MPAASGSKKTDLSFEINEPDAYALEEALLLKEKHGGEVVVLCAGPGARRQHHSRGAGEGRRPRHPHRMRRSCAHSTRSTWPAGLAAAAAPENARPDPHRPAVRRSRLGADRRGHGGDAGHSARHHHHGGGEDATAAVRVKRELEDGWFQWVEMPLPALLTIQSGISKLRYATLMGIKKAKTKEVRRVAAQRSAGAAAPLRCRSTASTCRRARRRRRCSPAAPIGSGGETGGNTEIRGARDMNGVLVILEYRGGWNRMSWEALAAGAAARRANSVSRCWPRSPVDRPMRLSVESAQQNVDAAYAVEHELLRRLHGRRLYRGSRAARPRSWIRRSCCFPHTYQVRDFAPRLATRFDQMLIADVIGFRMDGGRPVLVRQLFQGKLNADYRHSGDGPCFVSIQAGAFRARHAGRRAPAKSRSSRRTRPRADPHQAGARRSASRSRRWISRRRR